MRCGHLSSKARSSAVQNRHRPDLHMPGWYLVLSRRRKDLLISITGKARLFTDPSPVWRDRISLSHDRTAAHLTLNQWGRACEAGTQSTQPLQPIRGVSPAAGRNCLHVVTDVKVSASRLAPRQQIEG